VAFLSLLVMFTAVYGSATFYFSSPRPAQPFIAWGVYSERGLLSEYVPGSNLTVSVNQTLNWHFQITNRMGVVQFIKVVYRIGNTTSAAPSSTQAALTVPEIGRTEKFVPNLAVSRIDFTWRVLSAPPGDQVKPVLEINGQTVQSEVGAASGRELMFFFELWTFEVPTGSFQYGWEKGETREASWLKLSFNIST
jgi:hypothetical protein